MAPATKSARVVISHTSYESWKKTNKIKTLEWFTTKKGRFSATIGDVTLMTTVGFDREQPSFIIADKNRADLLWRYNQYQPTSAFKD